MRILLYTPTVGRGGVHRVVEKLFPALVSSFPNVDFAVFGQKYDEIGLEVHYPCEFIEMPPYHAFPPHPHQFPYLLANHGRFYAHLLRKAEDFDLIYCPSPWWTMGFVRWTLTKPFVTTLSDLAFDVIDMGDLARHFRSTVIKMRPHVSAFVVHSQYWKTHAEERYQLPNVHIVEHTSDFVSDNFTPTVTEGQRVRAKYGLPERYVLAFHCYGHKDPVTIVRGHAWARANNADIPPLVIAGIDTGSYVPGAPISNGAEDHVHEVRRAIQEVGAQHSIILGNIADEDIGGLYQGAACAVSATLSEGDLPGTAFEAIEAHIPFVCSDFPIFTEKLGHGRAWIFERRNVEALGIRLIEACTCETASRVTAAYARLAGRTVHDVAESYMSIFRSVLNA